VEQLRIPGMRRPAFSDAMRPIFAAAKIANVTAPEKDDLSTSATRLKRTLQFSLPRGAYATVLLRALGQ
jgi:tRNA(Glu) U13 pseudouridine synthase TruD